MSHNVLVVMMHLRTESISSIMDKNKSRTCIGLSQAMADFLMWRVSEACMRYVQDNLLLDALEEFLEMVLAAMPDNPAELLLSCLCQPGVATVTGPRPTSMNTSFSPAGGCSVSYYSFAALSDLTSGGIKISTLARMQVCYDDTERYSTARDGTGRGGMCGE